MHDPRRQRQFAAFLLGILLVNFPALAVVDRITLGGMPATPLYLFLAWAAMIGLAAWALARRRG